MGVTERQVLDTVKAFKQLTEGQAQELESAVEKRKKTAKAQRSEIQPAGPVGEAVLNKLNK